MAKTKTKSPAMDNDDLRELIVVMSPESGIRSRSDNVASATNADVSSLNKLMEKFNIELTPIFGPENRTSVSARGAMDAATHASFQLDTFYIVTSGGDKDEIASQLLKDVHVSSAYVKPASEAPTFMKEVDHSASPDVNFAPPATPDFKASQVYLNAAPAGIDALYAQTLPGGKGNNIRIIDIEGAWRFTHEDLITNQGGVIGGTQSTDIGWRNHGTAVIGEFGGDENGTGVTGICPNANTRAISIFGGLGSAQAIRNAADALTAGDIILLELHRPGPRHAFASRNDQAGYIAIEWWPDDFAAIKYATAKGVLVVEAAGNGAENLDDVIYNTRPAGFPVTWTNPFSMINSQSGAIVVGAGAPPPGTHGRDHGVDRSRLGFSNYGSRLDVQGWGREVTTCGYGHLQTSTSEDFWYTDQFSGTSSASPIVVGALGCIQGRLKNRSKPLLTPSTATNLLRTTGSPQQDTPGRPATQRIGNRPDLKQAFQVLNIDKGFIADKILVKEFKELEKVKDTKELFKEQMKEFEKVGDKQFKEFEKGSEKQLKEFDKVGDKQFKEFEKGSEKQLKEFDKVGDKQFKEKDFEKGLFEGIGGLKKVFQPTESPMTSDQRLDNMEQAIEMLKHFISGEQRPDLTGHLFDEG